MQSLSDFKDEATRAIISVLKERGKILSGADCHVFIRSYPKYTCAVLESSQIMDAKRFSLHLAGRRYSPVASALYHCGSYYLCMTMKTRDALRMLPAICEYSERVYLGRSYEAFIREHSRPLIEENAVEKLISE